MKSGIKGTIIAVLEPDASQNRRNVSFTAGTGTWRVITQCTFEHICTVQFLFEQIVFLLVSDETHIDIIIITWGEMPTRLIVYAKRVSDY